MGLDGSSKKVMKLIIKPSLNRAVTHTVFPMRKPLHFSITHHGRTSALEFQLDTQDKLIKSGMIDVKMFRNLENSKFCQAFINMASREDDKYDIRCKYNGLNRSLEQYLLPFLAEKIEFQVHGGNSSNASDTSNYMLVLGWKLCDCEDDLNFVYVQRKVYNPKIQRIVLRTAGIQFATKRGLDILDSYHERTLHNVKRSSGEDVSSVLDEIDYDEDIAGDR